MRGPAGPAVLRVMAWVAAACLLASCTNAEDEDEGPSGVGVEFVTAGYAVTYPDVAGYDAAVDGPELERCTEDEENLTINSEDSLPPRIRIQFSGPAAQQVELQRCLEGLDAAVIPIPGADAQD